MTKGSKSGVVGSVGTGKATEKEKGKRFHFRTMIGMDFDPKTFRLRNQEDVNKCLARYGVRLNSRIKVEFFPQNVNATRAPYNGGVYMHPRVLTLGLRLPMTTFIRSILTFYRVTPS